MVDKEDVPDDPVKSWNRLIRGIAEQKYVAMPMLYVAMLLHWREYKSNQAVKKIQSILCGYDTSHAGVKRIVRSI